MRRVRYVPLAVSHIHDEDPRCGIAQPSIRVVIREGQLTAQYGMRVGVWDHLRDGSLVRRRRGSNSHPRLSALAFVSVPLRGHDQPRWFHAKRGVVTPHRKQDPTRIGAPTRRSQCDGPVVPLTACAQARNPRRRWHCARARSSSWPARANARRSDGPALECVRAYAARRSYLPTAPSPRNALARAASPCEACGIVEHRGERSTPRPAPRPGRVIKFCATGSLAASASTAASAVTE